MASATQAAAISAALFATAPLHTKPRSVTFRITTSNPPIVGRKLRAAVIGAGPAGSSAAEALAAGGAECFLFERAPSEAKPCGGAIPICMLDEFDIPARLIDRHVTRMRIFSPSNLAVDFGKTLRPDEFIAMLRREVLDSFLRDRAQSRGASLISGLVTRLPPRALRRPLHEGQRAPRARRGRRGRRRRRQQPRGQVDQGRKLRLRHRFSGANQTH